MRISILVVLGLKGLISLPKHDNISSGMGSWTLAFIHWLLSLYAINCNK